MTNSSDLLKTAIDLHQRGELNQAAAIYESILAQDPTHADALHLLGIIALQRHQPEIALDFVRRSIARQPNNDAYYSTLGEVYWALGQPRLTVACCREALKLQPNSPDILSNLAATLLHLGEAQEAIANLNLALQFKPNSAAILNNLANAFRHQGDLSSALNAYAHAANLYPSSHEIQSNLGKTFFELGDNTAALEHCERAVKLRPDFAAGWANLGNVLHGLSRLDDAVACFHEAIRLAPNLPNAHAGLGNVLETCGDQDLAIASYQHVLKIEPSNPGVLARLAARLGKRLSDEHQAAIEQLLAKPSLSPLDRIPLLFGLAHIRDAQENFPRAAELTREANALRAADNTRRGKTYSPNQHHEFISAIINSFTPEFFSHEQGFGIETRRPIFVVGLPRSGTTLVEQILASHPDVFGAGELRLMRTTFDSLPEVTHWAEPPVDCVRHLDRDAVQTLARRYLDGMAAINSLAPRFVDKMPENTIYLGLIATLFPQATIIHCKRDIRDVATSCWLTYFAYLSWSCHTDHIASRIAEYQRVMNHWRRVLPLPIFDIEYEELVTNAEPLTRAMLAHCGLSWDQRCLEFHKTKRGVQTASVAQVRQPLYHSSIGRWKNYETLLSDLFDKLTPESS